MLVYKLVNLEIRICQNFQYHWSLNNDKLKQKIFLVPLTGSIVMWWVQGWGLNFILHLINLLKSKVCLNCLHKQRTCLKLHFIFKCETTGLIFAPSSRRSPHPSSDIWPCSCLMFLPHPTWCPLFYSCWNAKYGIEPCPRPEGRGQCACPVTLQWFPRKGHHSP